MKFRTPSEVAELVGTSASRVRNYIAMGAIDLSRTKDRVFIADGEEEELQTIFGKTRSLASKEPDNCQEIKAVMELTDILHEYFPIDNMNLSSFTKFHDEVIDVLVAWKRRVGVK